MKRWTVIALFAASALLAGCKKSGSAAPTAPAPATDPAPATPAEPTTATPPAGPAPTDAEMDAVGTKAIALIEALADAIQANEKDCTAMAAGIDKVVADNQAFLQEAKRYNDNAAFNEKLEARMKSEGVMDRVMPKMMPGMQACANDPKVEAAMRKMEE